MTEAQKMWREGFDRAAREQRLSEAQDTLSTERQVYDYLVSMNRDGAAKRVQDNITRMTQRVARYTQDLNG